MKSLLLSGVLVVLSFALALPASADPKHVAGSAGITDGDTIRIGKTRIRLFGIDAPERHQSCQHADGTSWACGADATEALAGFIAGREVECAGDEHDKYGRLVATCSVRGQDIGEWLVSSGWAVAYRRYSDRYIDEEAAAQAAKRGIWSGTFAAPWDWRKTR